MRERGSIYQNTERLAGLLSLVLAVGLQIFAGMLMVHICGWQVRPAPELLQLFTVVLPEYSEPAPAANTTPVPVATDKSEPLSNRQQQTTIEQQTPFETVKSPPEPEETVTPEVEQITDTTQTPVEKEPSAPISKPVDALSEKTEIPQKMHEPAKVEHTKKAIRNVIPKRQKPEIVTPKKSETAQAPVPTTAAQTAAMPSAVSSAKSSSAARKPGSSPDSDTTASPGPDPADHFSERKAPARPLSNDEQKEIARYLAQVRRSLEKSKKYPTEARKERLEGQVRVKFRITADGQAEEATITGQAPGILAESVLQMLAGRRFSAPPPGWQPNVAVELKINFNLR